MSQVPPPLFKTTGDVAPQLNSHNAPLGILFPEKTSLFFLDIVPELMDGGVVKYNESAFDWIPDLSLTYK